MSLEKYEEKRIFSKTEEPKPCQKKSAGHALRFVVQKHDASRLHYDFRLEYADVLLSWAVPKGPSMNRKDKRLAVRVEDHPYEYKDFEGTIPQGEYGGGTVMLWDEGTWEPEGEVEEMLTRGDLKFTLFGKRLQGKWVLVHMKPKPGEEDKNWLLIKEKDEMDGQDAGIGVYDESVRSNRTMKEISEQLPF
jgi:bifunctional non-homologous end joining protein LigD